MELEKKTVENGGLKVQGKKRLGGIRTMPFILGNEACERFAATGFHANMISYLTQKLNLPLVKASNTLTNFGGTAGFTPLIGALIADSFAGRFWTIIFASIIYELGMVSITASAVVPHLHPPPCPTQVNCKEASTSQLWVLYASLLLTSFGTGGIKPCVVTFAADQIDMTKSKSMKHGWNFFNWYYFIMGLANFLALTVVVYIQDNVGWGWGLGIPTMAMGLSIMVFVIGAPLYKRLKPGGSPLVRLAQVIVAAVKKKNVDVPDDDHRLLYENKKLDAHLSTNGTLFHSNQFRWFDRAAVVREGDLDDFDQPNLWRISTTHRVEELKSIIRVFPIWAAGILLVTSQSHLGSFTVQQARTMDRHLSSKSSFQMPPASLSIFSVTTMLIGLALYERVFVPFARRFTRNPAGITCLQRMGIGYAINIFATVVSAFVEKKRKNVAARYNLLDKPTSVIPISVFWLIPQYGIHGIAEVFYSVGHLEFLYDQSPESMRASVVALYSIASSIGNYLGTFLVSLVHKYTAGPNDTNWLPDWNLNRGELDKYYWLVTGIQGANLVYYVICAMNYTYKPLQQELTTEEGCDCEQEDQGNVQELATI